jgi:membrane associated rhomboid family serine protease
MFIATLIIGNPMYEKLSLFHFQSPYFRPYQLITHMFMHGGFWHIFFNMYTLFFFGCILENVWGGKKFMLFYLVTGLGAALCHSGVLFLQSQHILHTLGYASAAQAMHAIGFNSVSQAFEALQNPEILRSMSPAVYAKANALVPYFQSLNVPTVGASGAIYGLLLAYGMLFPNNQLQLIFPIPIALKAKWFVMIFGAIELITGVTGMGGNVAHFAHLGGMLFGYFMIVYWKKKGKMYY